MWVSRWALPMWQCSCLRCAHTNMTACWKVLLGGQYRGWAPAVFVSGCSELHPGRDLHSLRICRMPQSAS